MAIVIISILVMLACFLFLYRKTGYSITKNIQVHETTPQPNVPADRPEVEMLQRDQQCNRTGVKKRKIRRKTYLSGFLRGKYWGEMAIHNQVQYEHEAFFEFHIYEADVYIEPSDTCSCISLMKTECSGLHTEAEGKFGFLSDSGFPRERLPQLLPIIVKNEGKEYIVNIREPKLANVKFISRLHQTKGKEVFGTIEANISGFLLDFIEEEYAEPEYSEDIFTAHTTPANNASQTTRKANNRAVYHNSTARRNRYNAFTPNDGCVSSLLGILVILVWVIFLIILLPQTAIILPFIAVPLLFRLIPAIVWKCAINIISAVIFIGFFVSIISIFQNGSAVKPSPVALDNTVADTINQTYVNDTVITHYLKWKNYDGKEYQGEISVRRSALHSASQFKMSLKVAGDTRQSYDEAIYQLKEHDKANLSGVYQLFDSIRSVHHLKEDKFAELIVSFVQHIPYAVVLPEACNASLYSDQFIRKYLAKPDARCDGNEKFGINTPVEFMASLNGDCDTRTLLLYTMLCHYKYDVALLSSEYYNHSLIGINLPYNGAAFMHDSKQYVLWETTADGIRPGILPDEISNLDYWRISLKSE